MAKLNFTTNTYAGDALNGFMASTLLETDSLERGLVTLIPDVKGARILLDVDDIVKLQNPSAIFVDQATTTLQNETPLTPVPYEFMKQEDYSNLYLSWESDRLKPGALRDYEGDMELIDFMAYRYKGKLQIANEKLYWLGKGNTSEASGLTAAYPGLLPQIIASGSTFKLPLIGFSNTNFAFSAISGAGVVTVSSTANLASGDVVTILVTTGTLAETTTGQIAQALLNVPVAYTIIVNSPTTFTLSRNYTDLNIRNACTFTGTATAGTVTFINVSNVMNVIQSVYAQMDFADRVQSDFNILVPIHVAIAYKEAQSVKNVNYLGAFSDEKKLEYLGTPLQPMKYFSANTIVCARASNLFVGVDLLNDTEFRVTYMGDYTLDNVVRMKARMKSCTNVKFFNEVLLVN